MPALLQSLFDLYKANKTEEDGAAEAARQPSRARAAEAEAEAAEEVAWRSRQAVGLALAALAPQLHPKAQAPLVFAFLKRALADGNDAVNEQMIAAGRALIEKNAQPEEMVSLLAPMFDAFLAEPATTATHDRVRQGVIQYTGALAKHIPPDDPRVEAVVVRLIDALSTPSEAVQRAVATSLASLIPKAAVKPTAPEKLKALLEMLLTTTSYAERRGAAFGLAGVVKGLGIPSLKQQGVMTALQAAVEDKTRGEGASNAREGALHAFQCLCEFLGRLFEPYVVAILPLLLTSVADGSGPVRHAAVAAAEKIMGQLSAQGVKMVLPALLRSLEEDKWRTKHAAVEILATMAHCAPKQLSSTLPQVVPALTEVLTHSHPRVQEGANAALAGVGAVIKNPEIGAIVPTLLAALSQPAKHTTAALDALAHCQFEHCVDPPSLSLIVPVLHRGLRERAAQAKRKTAHITGNMCSLLADRTDIVPYLKLILPELKAVLVDPIPEVRATGAKALGRLCAGLGEEHFPELIPWLTASLADEASSAVERAGAAQGLSEVLGALGDAKLEGMLAALEAGCELPAALAREGYSMLWVHLPPVFGARFERFLPRVLPRVLGGLADEAEPVRDASMRAAQAVIATYREASAGLLLPPLQAGLTDANYRIRQSSAELLGELMLRLTDSQPMAILEKGEANAPDSPLASIAPAAQHALLAALYIARNDEAVGVRQAANFVWKSLVSNAPKALRIVLPTLTEKIIGGLAADDEEEQQTAARALGELVSKLAERVLPTLIPNLQRNLREGGEAERIGVCLGLTELMGAAGKDLVLQFLDDLLPAVRLALCDGCDAVREAAAGAFNALQRLIGQQAVHEIVPSLLQLLRSGGGDESESAKNGLRVVVAQRPAAVVPFLVPKLCATPVTLVHAKALAAVAACAGAALYNHLDAVVPALLEGTYAEAELAEAAGAAYDPELRDALVAATRAVGVAVDDDGFHHLLAVLSGACMEKSAPHVRVAAAALVAALVADSPHDLSEYHPQFMAMTLGMFHAPQPAVLRAGWAALDAVVKGIPKERYALHVTWLRQQLQAVAEEHRLARRAAGAPRDAPLLLPGLCLPKGLTPLQAVFQHGLLTASPELREQAAAALGEAISLTSAEALKPSVIAITGPLIRIVGDRFPWGVKAAILHTLRLLIEKGAVLLKPFVPQLQTTFVKALSDATKAVRERGAAALHKLAALSTRVEPLLVELNGALLAAEAGVQHALLSAIAGVLRGMPKAVGEGTLQALQHSATELLTVDDDGVALAAAATLGGLGLWLPLPPLLAAIEAAADGDESGEAWRGELAQLRAHLALLRALKPAALADGLSEMLAGALEAAASERSELRQPAAHSLARIAAAMAEPPPADGDGDAAGGDEAADEALAEAAAAAVPESVPAALAALLGDRVVEVRCSALHALKRLCRLRPALVRARRCALPKAMLGAVAAACADKRSALAANGAQRTMLALALACGWTDGERAPAELADTEHGGFVADYARRHLKRQREMDSEADSDGDGD